jgi:hypothetical protein
MKLAHHIKGTTPAGIMTTYCGLEGIRALGSGIDIKGKWSPCTGNSVPNVGSCLACVEAMPAAVKPPTIYTDLKSRLGREPTNIELIKECKKPAKARKTTEIKRKKK